MSYLLILFRLFHLECPDQGRHLQDAIDAAGVEVVECNLYDKAVIEKALKLFLWYGLVPVPFTHHFLKRVFIQGHLKSVDSRFDNLPRLILLHFRPSFHVASKCCALWSIYDP
jgi:hypothetical protein